MARQDLAGFDQGQFVVGGQHTACALLAVLDVGEDIEAPVWGAVPGLEI